MSPPETPPDFEDHSASNRRRPGSRLSQSFSAMFQSGDSSESTLDSGSGNKRDSFYREREALDPASYGT